MPTYLYETLPAPGVEARRFELRQSIGDAALTIDPETGAPVRRVISGGLGIMTRSEATPAPSCGPETCRCGKFG